ncbi:MAG: hypothetical protein FWF57_06740 [Defluviitaleaceae bacterium]|nr:hypothetical protein [Defluviitaleaceae bacterium]
MNDFELKIKFLIDIAKQKIEILKNILNITINQKSLLEPPFTDEIKEIFKLMNIEKFNLIEELKENDMAFANIFESLENFEENTKLNREIVKNLQKEINIVSEIDIKIRIVQEENEKLIFKKSKDTNIPVQSSKILNKYKQNFNFNKQNNS